jgi:hypothetical protein
VHLFLYFSINLALPSVHLSRDVIDASHLMSVKALIVTAVHICWRGCRWHFVFLIRTRVCMIVVMMMIDRAKIAIVSAIRLSQCHVRCNKVRVLRI